MFKKVDRKEVKERRYLRARKKVLEIPGRPGPSVYRSEKDMYAQIIDDANAVTLVTASSLNKAIGVEGSNKEAAKLVGELIAKRAIGEGINDVVLNRGGYVYHGRVKVLVSGAGEAGLKL